MFPNFSIVFWHKFQRHIEISVVIIEKPFRSICVYCIPAAPTVNTVDTFLKQLINNTEKLNVIYIFH